jgi:hypothetical protein
VRYALACEFSRQPIRRTEVVKKVMDDEVGFFCFQFVDGEGMEQWD